MSKIIAHRGASGYAPENTMPAFEMALEMNAEGIEIDVHTSKDGEVVVIHDPTINRTSNGEGLVGELTLEELRSYDYGSWYSDEFKDTTIPTLREVLELLKDWEGLLNIEIKSGPHIYEGIEQKVIDLIKEYKMEDRIIISSFNHYSLRDIKKIDPNIKIGLLYAAGLVEPWIYAKRMDATALHPSYYNIIPEVVDGCKENGIQLNPYTINDESDLERMVDAGVDGIITNYPDRALKVRERMKK